MTLRSSTTFSVKRALHQRVSSKGSQPPCLLETGKSLSAATARCLGFGPSQAVCKSGLGKNPLKSSCQCIQKVSLNARKDFLSLSEHNVSSRYYHSSSSIRNFKSGLPDSARLGYHFPTPYLIRSKWLSESRLFSTLESSPYASLHTSRQRNAENEHTIIKSPVFMEEEESVLRETIGPLLWKFLSRNPFLSSTNTMKDPVSYALSRCQDVAGVLAIVETNHDDIDIGRACVAITKLWSLDTKSESNSFIPRLVPLPSRNLLSRHPASVRLLQVIERDYMSLDDESLVCLLTYLTNIGVPTETPVVQKLFLRAVDRIDHLDLPTVTRIFVFLRSPDLNHHVKGKFIPRFTHFLDNCSTVEELHLINLCFIQTKKLFQHSFNVKHSQKIVDLIDSGVVSASPTHTDILINTLRAVTDSNSVCVYEESISKMFRVIACRKTPYDTDELMRLNVVCRILSLHRSLMFKLNDQAARDIADCQDPVRQAQLFLCLNPRSLRKFSKSVESVVAHMLNSPDYEGHLLTVYYILRLRVLGNFALINDFWEKLMALTEASVAECAKHSDDAFGKEASLARITQRYLAFNSNLGGQYRHLEVEKRLLELLLEEMTTGASSVVVGRLSRMASFVVAYSGPCGVPLSVMHKLERNVDQFDLRDLLNMTTGLQISLSLTKRTAQPVLVDQLVKLACLLSTVSRRIAQSSTNLVDISSLVRASAVYDQVFTRFPNYTVSQGVDRGISGRPFGAQSLSHTNNQSSNDHWSFVDQSSGSELTNSLPGRIDSHRLLSSDTKDTPPWLHPNFTSNHLPEHSGDAMPGMLTPNFDQRAPVVAGQPLDSQWGDRQKGWLSNVGGGIMDRSPSTTSSVIQMAPLLTPHTKQMSIKASLQLLQTFSKTGFANMQVLDSVLQYLTVRSSVVPGRIVAQALFTAFSLGHNSNLPHHNITTLAAVITQDGSALHGMQLLQATLSLCFYQALSRALIASVFNVEFLDLLDEEMETCYNKPRQPQRLRQLLMEVNRGVCIDYPEARVPWFHDQYCNDSIQTASHHRNGFRSEVQSCLSGLLGGEDACHANTYSPYFYPLDFSFELDNHGNALKVEPQSQLQPRTAATLTPLAPGHKRFCVLLLNPMDYSVLQLASSTGFQQVYQLKGTQQLKQRHLEVLGYRVICVPRHEWQSMALATPDSKRNYLRRMIWPSDKGT